MRTVASLLLAALLATSCSANTADVGVVCVEESFAFEGLVVAGSGAGLPLMRALANAWQDTSGADAVHVAESIGSSGAAVAVGDGAVQVGVLSRDPRAEELARVSQSFPLVETLVVFAAGEDVPTRNLSRAELVSLYAGETRTWSDGTPVVLVVREDGDSAMMRIQAAWPDVYAAMVEARERGTAIVSVTDQDTVHTIATVPGAIGPTDLGLVTLSEESLVALSVDGVSPSWIAHDAGRYQPRRALHLVIGEDPRAEAFVRFALALGRDSLFAASGYRRMEVR